MQTVKSDCKSVILRDHPGFVGERLDVFLAAQLDRSRSHAQTLLRQGLVELQPDAAKIRASYRLRVDDTVLIRADETVVADPAELPRGEDIPLAILHEDEALLAVNKPAGLVVHPAVGHRTGTLVNALVHHLGESLAGRGGSARPGIVHRLDKDTSGVLVIAKTDIVHEQLARAFAERRTRKLYRALCWGRFRRASGECRGRIARHPVYRQKMAVTLDEEKGRSAWTDYRVLGAGARGSEVECVLHTGRTHQIRVHLAHLGYPVWGDLVYGRSHPVLGGFHPARQMLHAALLEIEHPLTGKLLRLEAPLPDDYLTARTQLLEGVTST